MELHAVMVGTMPLMMHNVRLADPMDYFVKQMKLINAKRSKDRTDEDHLQLSRTEWEGGLYWDKDLGPYLNAHNTRACLIKAARAKRWGAHIERALMPIGVKLPLQYSGPRDVDGLWNAGFYDRRSAKVQSNVVQRTRPFFDQWSIECDYLLDTELFDYENLRIVFDLAGKAVGLGDGRSMGYGRFKVQLEVTEDDRPISA